MLGVGWYPACEVREELVPGRLLYNTVRSRQMVSQAHSELSPSKSTMYYLDHQYKPQEPKRTRHDNSLPGGD